MMVMMVQAVGAFEGSECVILGVVNEVVPYTLCGLAKKGRIRYREENRFSA